MKWKGFNLSVNNLPVMLWNVSAQKKKKKKKKYILIVALESRGRLDTMIHVLNGLCTAQELF